MLLDAYTVGSSCEIFTRICNATGQCSVSSDCGHIFHIVILFCLVFGTLAAA